MVFILLLGHLGVTALSLAATIQSKRVSVNVITQPSFKAVVVCYENMVIGLVFYRIVKVIRNIFIFFNIK